jgi:hypothetical protein
LTRNPVNFWIPACAGMTFLLLIYVVMYRLKGWKMINAMIVNIVC